MILIQGWKQSQFSSLSPQISFFSTTFSMLSDPEGVLWVCLWLYTRVHKVLNLDRCDYRIEGVYGCLVGYLVAKNVVG